MSESENPAKEEDDGVKSLESSGGGSSLGESSSAGCISVKTQISVQGTAEGESREGAEEESNAKKYQVSEEGGGEEEGDRGEVYEGEGGEEYSEDDTEVSSEAVVDDIELILMPEEVEDLPSRDNSPKLVRVTELNSGEYDGDDDFLKMDDDGDDSAFHAGGDNGEDDPVSQQSQDYYDDEGEGSFSESHRSMDERRRRKSSAGSESFRSGKVSSFVQTDISALEGHGEGGSRDFDDECVSENSDRSDNNWRRKSSGLSGGMGRRDPGGSLAGGKFSARGKKLNWKSELALLPSKTRLSVSGSGAMKLSMDSGSHHMPGSVGFGAFNYYAHHGDSSDTFSPRVAKFTSQDNVMSSSSQFLKPSTLYRTRNLSRNLNHFASSETTLVQDQLDSPRCRTSNTQLASSSSAANFKGSSSQSSNQICMTAGISLSARRRPSHSSAKVNFRQSLPDLSTSDNYFPDNNRRRQVHLLQSGGGGGKFGGSSSLRHGLSQTGKFHQHLGSQRQSGGMSGRLQKKSSSDDETSSLIDESERCLRSSIDLLLMDDHPGPGYDYPYNPKSYGGGGQFHYPSSSTSGYYSARRSCSQPIFPEQSYAGEIRDNGMGSPFLPRKLSDMRCSRWAKVILPNGLVAVVAVKETDEIRDTLTIHTDTGCIITLPFRKVVFAWKIKR